MFCMCQSIFALHTPFVRVTDFWQILILTPSNKARTDVTYADSCSIYAAITLFSISLLDKRFCEQWLSTEQKPRTFIMRVLCEHYYESSEITAIHQIFKL